MISFRFTYILMIIGLFSLIPFGKCIDQIKSCVEGFARMPKDRDPMGARSYCTDGHDTWSYPNEDCKPSLHVNQPPAASKCNSKGYPAIKSGSCPTYRPYKRNEKNEVILYACDILIKQGATIDKDKHYRMPCGSLTNKITCNGPRGRFETTMVPY